MPVFFSGVFLIIFLYIEYRRRKKKRAMERCVHLPPPPPFPLVPRYLSLSLSSFQEHLAKISQAVAAHIHAVDIAS